VLALALDPVQGLDKALDRHVERDNRGWMIAAKVTAYSAIRLGRQNGEVVAIGAVMAATIALKLSCPAAGPTARMRMSGGQEQ
jgi:hypothetical protein